MKKLTIDRTKWLRGKGAVPSALLVKDTGQMCCLGFYCQSLGIPDEEMAGVDMPFLIAMSYKDIVVAAKLADHIPDSTLSDMTTTTFSNWAAVINDACNINDEDRERRLTALFAEHNVELEFIN